MEGRQGEVKRRGAPGTAARLGKRALFGLNQSKAWHLLTGNLDGLLEQAQGTHPKAVIAIQGLIEDHFFLGLGMPRDAEYAVLRTFVMLVEPRLYRHALALTEIFSK